MAQEPVIRVKPEVQRRLKLASAIYGETMFDLANKFIEEGIERLSKKKDEEVIESSQVDVVL